MSESDHYPLPTTLAHGGDDPVPVGEGLISSTGAWGIGASVRDRKRRRPAVIQTIETLLALQLTVFASHLDTILTNQIG